VVPPGDGAVVPPGDGAVVPPGDGGGGGPVCALYGQICATTADCCNGVPCNAPTGVCAAGMTGCTCHYIIQ
jgi:hypothetical protein